MKRFLALFAALVLAALMFVSASAASVAKFNLNIVSETDTEAVVSIDFEGGAGFAGIDIDVVYDSKKVKIMSIESGSGLDAFSAQEKTGFYEANKDKAPAKIAMISTKAFKLVGKEKDLFVISVKKLSKEKLSPNDLKVVFTNCVDMNFNPITPSVTTELQGEVATTTTTVAVSDPTSGDASQSTTTEVSSSVTDEQMLTNAVEPDTEALDMEENEAEDAENGAEDNSKTIIIIAVAVVAVGAIAAVTFIVVKKKTPKKDEE